MDNVQYRGPVLWFCTYVSWEACCDNMQWDGTREGQAINIPVPTSRHEPLIGQTSGIQASDWSIIWSWTLWTLRPFETIPSPGKYGQQSRQKSKKWGDSSIVGRRYGAMESFDWLEIMDWLAIIERRLFQWNLSWLEGNECWCSNVRHG